MSSEFLSFLIFLARRWVGNTIGCLEGELDAGLAFFFLFEFRSEFLIFLTADQRCRTYLVDNLVTEIVCLLKFILLISLSGFPQIFNAFLCRFFSVSI